MGWDAYANKKSKEFKKVAEKVKKMVGLCDGLLFTGGLDVSTCGRVLADITGCGVYDEEGWSASKVQRLAKECKDKWPEYEGELWAVLSAKMFLETCAKIKCGIHFSW